MNLTPASSASSAEPRPLTVSELTRAIKRILETEVGNVSVEGEISNWVVSARGHAYFALKDADAVLSCVLFQGARRQLDFEPEDGMQAIARGSLSVYEPRGQYQMVVRSLRQAGLGDLYRRFLELKEKLQKEGLFNPETKRPLPRLPRRIGVVTSATGAAIRDIVNVITRRSPCVEVVLSPSLVQGVESVPSILRALKLLMRYHELLRGKDTEATGLDVVIVGRGGGSIEDLWAFNDERIARALAAYPVPVVSAVGHETDFTIADFVADLRAPTPSAAAELVVAERSNLEERLDGLRERLARALGRLAESRRLELRRLTSSWGLRQPLDLVRQATQRVDDLATRLESTAPRLAEKARIRHEGLRDRLRVLDPNNVLKRGYSVVTRTRDGRVVTKPRDVRVSDHIRVQVSEGEFRAAVLKPGDDLFDGLEDARPS